MPRFCVNCGVELDDDDIFCGECGAKQFENTLQANCREEAKIKKVYKNRTTSIQKKPLKPKKKAIAGVLAITFGWCGAHWFYLNKPGRALIYFAAYMIFPYFWIAFMIEGVYFLCISSEKFDSYRGKGNKLW